MRIPSCHTVAGGLFVLVAVVGSGGQALASSFAYVANTGSNNVSAYSINAGTGALTPVAGSPFAAGSVPESVVTTGITPIPTLNDWMLAALMGLLLVTGVAWAKRRSPEDDNALLVR